MAEESEAHEMLTEQQAYETLRAAQLHEHEAPMASSAKLCAEDAEKRFNAGDLVSAYCRAMDSLAYSVGIGSPVYARLYAYAFEGSPRIVGTRQRMALESVAR